MKILAFFFLALTICKKNCVIRKFRLNPATYARGSSELSQRGTQHADKHHRPQRCDGSACGPPCRVPCSPDLNLDFRPPVL